MKLLITMRILVFCFLSIFSFSGNSQEGDLKQALEACEQGESDGCYNLGNFYGIGNDVERDYTKAHKYFAKACDLDNSNACLRLGLATSRKGDFIDQNIGQAKVFFAKACDLNNSDGCVGLGGLYNQGVGVTQDFTKASHFFKKACDTDSPIGCGALGKLYFKGNGVRQDINQAKKLFRHACSNSHQDSCDLLRLIDELDRRTRISDSMKKSQN